MKNGHFSCDESKVVVCNIINKWDGSFASCILYQLSILFKYPRYLTQIRIDYIDILMKIFNKLMSRKHILSLKQSTIQADFSHERGSLRIWICKELSKNNQIGIEFTSLSYEMLGNIQWTSM